MFEEYDGELMGLAVNENHRVYRWSRKDCKILFSVTQMGEAASCHFASDKPGLRYLKQAINDFTMTCFNQFDWCKVIIAIVKHKGTKKLLSSIGFKDVLEISDHSIMVRRY